MVSEYEKLGSFYLGDEYDIEKREVIDDLLLYESKDLVTHRVVLGMTGSGKTRICIGLLEEAIRDNIPAIVIDPKRELINEDLVELEAHLAGEIRNLEEEFDAFTTELELEPIKPFKKDIDLRAVALVWLPYNDEEQPAW